MKHRQKTIAEKDWDGEFASHDEWARLGPQPPYPSATFVDAQGRRCITQQDFARAREPFAGAGPMVRIRFPPAVSHANFDIAGIGDGIVRTDAAFQG
jgi:hypothetical protein